jgi:ER-bound oxygenase mpaB/B'/Rubber oxygenase, catalytic domain
MLPATAGIPTALIHAEEAVARHGDRGRMWLDGMWWGDPRADAVVGDGAGLIRRAIGDGIDSIDDPPESLVSLFADLDDVPEWLDRDRCDRAAEHLVRQSTEFGVVLAAASLVAGAQNSVAGKPLSFTGRYAGDVGVRSLEVASWLTAVTTPGGLERGGIGFERTVRVRMIHAHVRCRLAVDERWDADAWGIAIPQPYMAYTLAEFCSIALRAMTRLGARYSDEEISDICHLWRYVGHLIGVDEAFLPVALSDYEWIEDLYALTGPGPDDADREFITALAEFQAAELGRALPERLRPRTAVQGLQRAFVGDPVADELGIPDTAWKHLPRLTGPITAAVNAAHDAIVPDGADRRAERAFRRREVELARLRAKYRVDHELVDDDRSAELV